MNYGNYFTSSPPIFTCNICNESKNNGHWINNKIICDTCLTNMNSFKINQDNIEKSDKSDKYKNKFSNLENPGNTCNTCNTCNPGNTGKHNKSAFPVIISHNINNGAVNDINNVVNNSNLDISNPFLRTLNINKHYNESASGPKLNLLPKLNIVISNKKLDSPKCICGICNNDDGDDDDIQEDGNDDDEQITNKSVNDSGDTTEKETETETDSGEGLFKGSFGNTNIGQLFFESLINRLNNVEEDSSKRMKSNPETGKSPHSPSRNVLHKKNKKSKNDDDVDENGNKLEYEWLGANINNIDDLIELGKTFPSRKRKRYNINLKQLHSLVEPLTELKNMVGMTDVKKIIFDQLIYYLQNLDDKNVDMLHTVIVGPPGVGKTQLTHIIAKIYNRLGFLKTDKVLSVKRDDLIGEYVGQTAIKTRRLLDKALGGVLLLDEVYSLSPTSERDFAREAIDMINMYLSEHAHDLVCVVAGYKKPTYEKFFSQNEGLARRFTHHFEIKGYNADELALIFKKYLENQNWNLGSLMEEIIPLISKNMDIFPNFGGDMTTLFGCCKKTHSKRLLTIPDEAELIQSKKKIIIADIITGIELYKNIKQKNENNDDIQKYTHMYS